MAEQCSYVDCSKCPLSMDNNPHRIICGQFEWLYPSEAARAVQDWLAEHAETCHYCGETITSPTAIACKGRLYCSIKCCKDFIRNNPDVDFEFDSFAEEVNLDEEV